MQQRKSTSLNDSQLIALIILALSSDCDIFTIFSKSVHVKCNPYLGNVHRALTHVAYLKIKLFQTQ